MGRGAFAKFRNIRRISLSCPTCQVAWSNAGRRLLCMGLFSIFWQRPLRRPKLDTAPARRSAGPYLTSRSTLTPW
ncbi:hypothetical protein FNJ47_28530 [Bradyrhizobium sp. UFLA 03-164]|uniref:Uncharacterized protein n=1 Tax=Bradyrhizobium uaiense TaxID=2594946 RepID=A0A6P1BMP5_9BRAD|nr:hypothetical protein [Bradyrhizobium uaiense]